MRSLIVAGWAGLAALLTFVIAVEVHYDAGAAARNSPTRHALGDAPHHLRHDAQRPTVTDQAAILSRPLFAPDRRPPPVVANAVPASSVASARTLPRLTGIVIDDPTRLAIFQLRQERPMVLAVGDEIAGQRVVAIDAGEIVTRGSMGEQRMQPSPDNNNAVAKASTAAASPPPIMIQPTSPQRRGEPRPHAGVFREETGFRIIDRVDH